MNPDEQLGPLTRREWSIVMAGLGELQGKMMYEVAKKVESLLAPPKDGD